MSRFTHTCASFFAGVGGIDLAFQRYTDVQTIYANEIDPLACKTFENNFDVKVDNRDIRTVHVDDIPDFDIMLAGFPCQAFSCTGYSHGFLDKKGRGLLFFELERIFVHKRPHVIFLENVKGLLSQDSGNTFRVMLEKLNLAGYHVKYQVLNATIYGNIPQNRERLYVVAFRDERLCRAFRFPEPVVRTTKLCDFIDFHNKVDARYYYDETCDFYNQLVSGVVSQDTVYQWRRTYLRENKHNVCPTLTANMGTGGNNVPLILADHGVRRLTPLECFNLQGFGGRYVLPVGVADSHLYKQAGNSVAVPVVSEIAGQICRCFSLFS